MFWGNNKFSIDSGTSPQLGDEDGGYAIGSDGWLPGGGAFLSYSLSPKLNLGFALTGNFGAAVKYDDDRVGRYYVKETTLLGISFPALDRLQSHQQAFAGRELECHVRHIQDQGGDQQR